MSEQNNPQIEPQLDENQIIALRREKLHNIRNCLLYTSDAADE